MDVSNVLDLTTRTYLITGAASGIGRTTSIMLSQYGANVILVDVNEQGLQETCALCKLGHANYLVINLLDVEAIKTGLLLAVEKFGKLNGFVHCAGIPYISPLKSISKEHCDLVYNINTYAGVELAKQFINRRIYAGINGSIVFISSVYGLVGSAANVGYALSKGANVAITKSLAMELAPRGIRVNCIAPGFIKTPMAKQVDTKMDDNYNLRLEELHPLGLGQTEDIAYGILYLLSDMSKWVTGTVMNIDGGFTAQ